MKELKDKIKILILDDEKQFTEELSEFFKDTEFEAFEANTASEGKIILNSHVIDLLILDVRLPGVDGLDILKDAKLQFPMMEVIIISAHGDMETVIKAMRLGAFDYLRKPFRFIDIQVSIERTRKYIQMHRKLKNMEERNSLISKSLEEKIDRHFIGVSTQSQRVFEQAISAAENTGVNVLITGESGTEKENIARIIHYSSSKKDNIMCSVNCSAITETLLESEFFGHKKGAFSGAISDKMGFLELSNKGTLFLDKIADIPCKLQANFLRAIEEKAITRVGDTTRIQTDFRIIAGTNQDLEQKAGKKEFRLDLLHRLNTIQIHIPALRERPEDIKPLLMHFANYYSVKLNKPGISISDEVFRILLKYDFPGNVRELRNLTERAIILCKNNVLEPDNFPVNRYNIDIEEVFNAGVDNAMISHKY
jgi:DNA-binding NtrC family response regulator